MAVEKEIAREEELLELRREWVVMSVCEQVCTISSREMVRELD